MHVGPHEPGRYRTTRFEPQLTLTLGPGWRAHFQDDSDELAFERSGPALFAVGRVPQVVEAGTTVDAPDDLVDYLTNHPGVEVDTNEPTIVAGMQATLLEGFTQPGANMDLFAYPTGNLHMTVGERVRFYVVPLDGPDLVISNFAKVAEFEAAMAEMEPIVESLEIAGTP